MTRVEAHAIAHLARRSVEMATAGVQADQPQRFDIQISTFGTILIFATIVLSVLAVSSVRYTLWGVVTTLACVEQPVPEYSVVGAKVNDDGTLEPDSEALVTQKPITSKIRSTVHHLKAKAGWTSRWRGLSLFIVLIFCQALLTGLLTSVIRIVPFTFFIAPVVAPVVASVLLARLETTWTHIVISEPSPKSWFHRLAPKYTMRNVWLPTAVAGVAAHLAVWMPAQVFAFFDLANPAVVNTQTTGQMVGKSIAVLVTGLITFVAISLPAHVALVRVQASMLSEEDETIVPFDRSFGSRVTPRIVGGTGAIDMITAWKSFDRAARARILKLFVKIFAIEIALHVFLGLIIGGELAAFAKISVVQGPQ